MDPLSLIGACVVIAKEICALKKNVDASNKASIDFFNRVQGLQQSLEKLQDMNPDELTSKIIPLRQVNNTLCDIDELLTKRMRNKMTVFGKAKNFVDAFTGQFLECIADLNVQLDRCLAALQLALTIDSSIAVRDDTSAIRSDTATIVTLNEQISEHVTSVSENTSVIRDQNNRILSQMNILSQKLSNVSVLTQLDVIAEALQKQSVSIEIEKQFTKDPMPEDEFDDRSVLGEGSFGVTHRMINAVDKGVYAVKEIKVKQALAAGMSKDDLRREAAILQKLNHPHVVRYFTSFFSRNENLYNVVMELIPGGSVADKVTDESVPLELKAQWLMQMASVLQYLHYEMRTQHRDIKPENIMLSRDSSRIKLIDLGTASMMKTVATKMTRAGTDMYFSYEKATYIPYDGRDDVWAAGCVFAELLVKARLIDRGGAIHMFHNKTVNDRRIQLIADCTAVSSVLGPVVGRMLEPEQEKRCTSEELVLLLTPAPTAAGVAALIAAVAVSETAAPPKEVEKLRAISDDTGNFKPFAGATYSAEDSVDDNKDDKDDRAITSKWTQSDYLTFESPASLICSSPDMTRFAVVADASMHIYDSATKDYLLNIRSSDGNFTSVCFSPDGSQLAAGVADGTVKLYACTSSTVVKSIRTYDPVERLSFSHDGSRIVASVGDGSYFVLSSSGSRLQTEHSPACRAVCFSRVEDSTTLVIAGEREISVIEDYSEVRLTIYCDKICSMCFASTLDKIFVGLSTGYVSVYDVRPSKDKANRKPIASFWAHNCPVKLSISEDESLLVSCCDEIVKLWNTSTYECVQSLFGHTNFVKDVCFASNNCVLSASQDKTLRVWEC